MSGEKVDVVVESMRHMARAIADAPMRDLEDMNRDVARIALTPGAFGAFGSMGGALGDAFDEVKLAAQTYLAAKRAQIAGIHDKAYDSANSYADGDSQAGQAAAGMTSTGK
jgi:hypothetical protein